MGFLPLYNSEKSRENLEIGSGHDIGLAVPAFLFLFYFILA